jgi:uncharacterized membrane protein YhfC
MEINWLLACTYIVAILIEIGLPVTLAILLIRKFKVAWVVVLTGVLTFIGSQVVHIPVLQIPALLYKAGVIKMLPQQWPIWAYALYLGLLAGLCEETARLIGFKILKNKAKDFNSSLALGIGHGGVESVIIGFIVLASLLSALLYNPQTQLAHGVAQDTVNAALAQISSFWSTAWHLPLAGAVERITAISAHLFMTVLVWQTVARGKAWGYPLAVLFHTVLDGASVWLSGLGLSVWQLEGCIAIFAVISLLLIWRFWVNEKASSQAHLVEAEPASELEKP